MTDLAVKELRDFRFTVEVLLAVAVAGETLDQERATPPPANVNLRFELLAAAETAEPTLPAEGWYDPQRLILARVSEEPGRLRLTLQAQGFAALERFAGRKAVVRDDAGRLDYPFGFDAGGQGVCFLADSAAVRAALRAFTVWVFDGLEPRP